MLGLRSLVQVRFGAIKFSDLAGGDSIRTELREYYGGYFSRNCESMIENHRSGTTLVA